LIKLYNLLKVKKLTSNQRASCWLELIAAISILIAVLVLRYTPAGRYFFCVFHKITGLPCLFCGMTRSLQNCLTGNICEALNFHLFGPLVLLIVVLWGLYRFVCAVSGYCLEINFFPKRIYKIIIISAAILLVIYWALRLLRVQPFVFPG